MTDEQHDEVTHEPRKRTWFDDDSSVYMVLGLVFLVIGVSGLANDSAQWTFLPIGIVFMAVFATSSRKKKRSERHGHPGGDDGSPAVADRGSDHDGGDGGFGGGDGGGGGGD